MFELIKKGEKSDRVRVIQEALVALGKLKEEDVDRDFGPTTQKALIAWETEYYQLGSVNESEYGILSGIASKQKHEKNTASTLIVLPKPIRTKTELINTLGKPWENPKEWEKNNVGLAVVPSSFKKAIPKLRIYCNHYIVQVVEETFSRIDQAGLASKIKTYDGCFNIRPIRGYEGKNPPVYSIHSWAMAIDLNAATNGLGVVGDMDLGLVKIFKDLGWVWGGDFRRKDMMHFQYVAKEVV